MNFIAFDAAYSLYPRATFKNRLNLALKDDDDAERRCLAKYAFRGWQTIANVWPNQPSLTDSFYRDITRRVGDGRCWVVKLDTTGVARRPRLSLPSEQFIWDPSEYNSWVLSQSSKPWRVDPTYHLVKTGVFRYAYLCANSSDHEVLKRHGQHFAELQWLKANRDNLPLNAGTWTWQTFLSLHTDSILMTGHRSDSKVPELLD
jgi:hypothetical protein